jgi:hypothetical protein
VHLTTQKHIFSPRELVNGYMNSNSSEKIPKLMHQIMCVYQSTVLYPKFAKEV